MDFVNLHHHSTFSYGDGFGTPATHAQRAAELGYTAAALTEHGLEMSRAISSSRRLPRRRVSSRSSVLRLTVALHGSRRLGEAPRITRYTSRPVASGSTI